MSPRPLVQLFVVFALVKLTQAVIIIFVPGQFDVSSRLLLEKYSVQKTLITTFHTSSARVNHILSSTATFLVERYFERLVTWDAVYFCDLFVNKLQYEHQFVFCPLWWRVIQWIPVNTRTSFYSRLIASTLLGNALHFAAAIVLYFYTRATFQSARIFSSQRMAMAALVLFVCLPAAAFLTAPYSESAASFCSFCCLYLREISTREEITEHELKKGGTGSRAEYELKPKQTGKFEETVTREFTKTRQFRETMTSGSIGEAKHFEEICSESTAERKQFEEIIPADSSGERQFGSWSLSLSGFMWAPILAKNALLYLLSGAFAALAFGFRANGLLLGLVYLYDLRLLPVPRILSLAAGLVLGAAFAAVQLHSYLRVCGTGRGEWCESAVPSLFTYAQAHYWNNGFLKYWTLGNVPNFLFAAPTVILLVLSVRYFGYMYPVARVVPVMVVNMAYILLQCFFWHVQIVTRVHTFLPVVYWLLAGLVTQGNVANRRWAQLALAYFAVWNVFQVALFAAFLPPA